jgi:hypothetical protein
LCRELLARELSWIQRGVGADPTVRGVRRRAGAVTRRNGRRGRCKSRPHEVVRLVASLRYFLPPSSPGTALTCDASRIKDVTAASYVPGITTTYSGDPTLISNSHCAVSPADLVSALQIHSSVVLRWLLESWRLELKDLVEGTVLAREGHVGL